MIFTIYKRALAVLAEKPFKLWGISWLCALMIYLSATLFLIPIAALAVACLFKVAMTLILLAGYRRQNVETLMIFDNFKNWDRAKRILCGMGWRALWIFIWSLIPVVGPIFAIIRAYEYRFVPYIMALQPEIAPKDALKESKKMTDGYKAKMFWADVLIPVIFGAALGIIGLLASIRYIGILFAIIEFVLILAWILFFPLFIGLVQAAWYEEVKNPSAPQKSMKPVCPSCGKTFKEGTKFCSNCGVQLIVPGEIPAPAPETAE